MDYGQYKQLEFRRKFLKIVGAEISVFTPNDQQVAVIHMKAWKLREDIRLYSGPDLATEALRIHARQIIDISATYDVFEGESAEPAFALRRKGLKSIFLRDHWDILDTTGNKIGEVVETSGTLAILRRWIGSFTIIGELIGLALAFTKQTYRLNTIDGRLLGTITHKKNPLLVRMDLDTSQAEAEANPAIPVAATTLLSIIDAVKSS